MTKDDIFNELKKILVSVFEIDEDDITLEANLVDDLELDSIDFIDMNVKLKEFTPEGKEDLDPTLFKTVRTVQDVVNVLDTAWNS